MKGRQVLIGTSGKGLEVAALMIDGRLQDVLLDSETRASTAPEAIHCATPSRPMKGLGGTMLDIGLGNSGYLRGTPTPTGGRPLLVQVTGWSEDGKAPRLTSRLRLKGRCVILTPDAPGVNVARAIRDPERRTNLEQVARAAMGNAPVTMGLILRSAAENAEQDEILLEIGQFLAKWDDLQAGLTKGKPACLMEAPGPGQIARREWIDRETEVTGDILHSGLHEELAALASPIVDLGEGFMSVEATRALVAVDINTGGDSSPAAGLKATIRAIRELPRQLRLRGLGGQITVDPAPFPHKQRKQVEAILGAAFRRDDIETNFAGWTPLGHIELQRKRARRPLRPEDFQIA